MSPRRTREDLERKLEEQRSFLVASCERFDQGHEEEAVRLAAIVRTLLHDTNSSHSLLDQLGIKSQTQYLDSSLPIGPQPVPGRLGMISFQGLPGLVAITFPQDGGKYVAPLSVRTGSRGLADFDSWWTEPCIPGANDTNYSRKKLVLALANTEGGSHVDEKIDSAYQAMSASGNYGTIRINDQPAEFTNSAAKVSMRQIVWELLDGYVLTVERAQDD